MKTTACSRLSVRRFSPENRSVTPSGIAIFLFLILSLTRTSAFGSDEKVEKNVKGDIAAAEASNTEPIFLLDVSLPITGATVPVVERTLRFAGKFWAEGKKGAEEKSASGENRRGTVLFRFCRSNDSGLGLTRFGDAYDLAELIRNRRFFSPRAEDPDSVRTVAIVDGVIGGNDLLPIFACDAVLAGRETLFGGGEAGQNREVWLRFFGKKGPEAIPDLWMKPSQTIYEAETESGTELFTAESLAAAKEKKTIFLTEPEKFPFPHGPGVLTASDLRRFGPVDSLLSDPNDPEELARFLEVEPLRIRRLIDRAEAKTGRIELTGEINSSRTGETIRSIRRAVDEGCSSLILEMDSPGGSPADSLALAGFLADDLDRSKVELIVWVPREARSDAALIALTGDRVYLGRDAVLGGEGAAIFSEADIDAAVRTIMEKKNLFSGRSRDLVAAMIDPSREVFRWSRKERPEEVRFLTGEEGAKLPDADAWIRGIQVTEDGVPFGVGGKEAVEFRLADGVAADWPALAAELGLDAAPEEFRLSPLDRFLRGLASPYWSAILLAVAFITLGGEMKYPGTGMFGVVSFLCFLLYFWAEYLDGSAGWLEILLFVFGVLCLLLEIFVIPGFGVFGIVGGLAVLFAIYLAGQSFVIPRNVYQFGAFRRSLIGLTVAGVGMAIFGWLSARSLEKSFQPRPEETKGVGEGTVDFASLLGRTGKTMTPLVPGGKANFDGEIISVLSTGTLVEKDAWVVVVEAAGNRVVVEKRDGDQSVNRRIR